MEAICNQKTQYFKEKIKYLVSIIHSEIQGIESMIIKIMPRKPDIWCTLCSILTFIPHLILIITSEERIFQIRKLRLREFK